MNYYVVETDKHKLIQKTAGVKARQDVETIFKWNNFKKIEIPCLIEGRENKTRLGKIKAHYDVYMLWKNALKKIKKNDWIYIQFPLLEHTMLFSLLIKNLEKRGIHTSIIIHDVEAIRFTLRNDVPLSRKIRMRFEEISSFKNCSKIIVHNEKMKSFMHEKWKIHKDKMDILGIFDYLVENYNEELLEKRNLSRKGPVIIAGALSKHKAGYIYNLPENCNFNLYGINFEREKASSNTNYVGAFNPEELIYNLQGSFGLVWDGDSSATCTGVYGDYLKINNPHKTSMYLAAGIPVIIWEEAALANFIKKNHCGITIKSTDEIRNIIDNTRGLSEGNYCYTRDCVLGLFIILLYGENGEAYNVANPKSHTTIAEMAHMVADKISNGKIKVIYDIPKDNVFGYAEDTKMKLNSDKLQALGWTPEIGLEDAYKRMIEQMKIEEI